MPPHSRSHPGHGSGPTRFPGTFVVAFREAAQGLNWQVRHLVGHLVECVDDQGKVRFLGLENLYRRVRRAPRSDWPVLIAEFLRNFPPADPPGKLPNAGVG